MAKTYTPSKGPLAGQPFASQQAYQHALAQTRGFSSYGQMRSQATQRFQPAAYWLRTLKQDLGKRPLPGYQKITKAGFNRHLRAIRQEARTKGIQMDRAGGALAKILEYLGHRVPGSTHLVGATP